MAEVATIEWPGQSGRTYKYFIYPLGTEFKAVGGNYIFASITKPGYWSPPYIGQTGNLSERFDNHHALACAKRQGATHIHVHQNDNLSARTSEEMDLIERWSPTCNVVGK